ncbi:MAG: hypothetical protein M3071_22105 [Actinomycetota bacterium]|nr:hypothetical protein [Actinomycetota bacterium]
MIHRALVLVALVCCGLVVASFVLFVRDQMAGASKQQAAAVFGPGTGQVVAPPVKQEAQPGRFINGAASKLTSPFRSIVTSSSAWVERGVPTILALLVYGVGLGYLARFSRGFA